jgi:hypothetical protein
MKNLGKIVLKLVLSFVLFGVVSAGIWLNSSAERPLAYVQKFKPKISVENTGTPQFIKERGQPLFNGDTLRTDKNGFALVQFMDKSLVKVKSQSRLIVWGSVEGKMNTSTRIGLKLGEIFMNVTDQGAGNFEVATNTSVASVKGTKFGAAANDYFFVEEGIVEILANRTGQRVTLTANQFGRVRDDGTIEMGELTDEEILEKKQEYEEMDAKLEPRIIKLRFIDENGQQQVIELKVFEN